MALAIQRIKNEGFIDMSDQETHIKIINETIQVISNDAQKHKINLFYKMAKEFRPLPNLYPYLGNAICYYLNATYIVIHIRDAVNGQGSTYFKGAKSNQELNTHLIQSRFFLFIDSIRTHFQLIHGSKFQARQSTADKNENRLDLYLPMKLIMNPVGGRSIGLIEKQKSISESIEVLLK